MSVRPLLLTRFAVCKKCFQFTENRKSLPSSPIHNLQLLSAVYVLAFTNLAKMAEQLKEWAHMWGAKVIILFFASEGMIID